MHKPSNVEQLFNIIDQSAKLIEEDEDLTYLDALILTGENIYNDRISQKKLIGKLSPLYDDFLNEGTTREDIRRAFQLAVLKGMKSGTQPMHQMTPDSVALFIGYLTAKLIPAQEKIRLLDIASGTGNLLTGVMNQLNTPAQAAAVEIDETLIKLANTTANLQQLELDLYHQDSLRPLFIDPSDVTICDLPVGIYPDTENAADYTLAEAGDEPYSHFLMIEQGLRYTKAGGYLIYVIPNDLFAQDEKKIFQRFLHENAFILGLLQLPETLFKDTNQAKSILLLRKKGGEAKAPEQALLAQLPSFSNAQAMLTMTDRINQWFEEYQLKMHEEG